MPNPRDVERVQRLFDKLADDEVVTPDEIAARLGAPRLTGRRLASTLRSLAKRKQIVRVRGQRFRRRPAEPGIEGVLSRRPGGHGQLRCEGESYFVPGTELGAFVDGDRVRARLDLDRRGRHYAHDLELAERRNRRLVGVIERVGDATLVAAEDGKFGDAVLLLDAPDVDTGALVEVELEPPPAMSARLVKVLGPPGRARNEVIRIVVNNGIELAHPPEVEAEAEAVRAEIPDAERARRVDLRDLPLVTIDGADACDFDDAVHVARTDDGWRLVVAIADVAHYVLPGSALDRDARRRTTSSYWPGGVAHMLPERLAAELCSLRPDVERLAMVAELDFDHDGVPLAASLFEAVIMSRARLTYEQVNAALGGDQAARREMGERWSLVETMGELAALLDARLSQGGRLELDIPEPFFTLDEQGDPIDAYPRPMGPAERLIEGFMVAANVAVARWCQARHLPVLYRVHEAPRPEKLALFVDTCEALTRQRLAERPSAQALSRSLHHTARDAERRLLSSLLLRSLPQARYDAVPLGHYGLGAPDYLHFTSPIRRYPDLLVHRALKDDLAERPPARLTASVLNEQATPINSRERAGMALERTIDSMLSARLASHHVGERFVGAVAGVERFGLFVSVDRPLFDGFLPVRMLKPDDYYEHSRDGLAMVGRRRRKRIRLGDPITVEIASVDVAKRQVDLIHIADD